MGGETDRQSPWLAARTEASEEEGCWQQLRLPFRDVVRLLLKREKSQKREEEEEDPFI